MNKNIKDIPIEFIENNIVIFYRDYDKLPKMRMKTIKIIDVTPELFINEYYSILYYIDKYFLNK